MSRRAPINTSMNRMILIALLFAISCVASEAAKAQSSTPQEVFDAMHRSFDAKRARGVHAVYQFDLSGPDGGLWWIEVNDAHCRFGRGRIDQPGVTFIASDRDWVALSNGTLSGLWAFVTGRLKIHGDQKLARELDDLFNR